jgi:hypothetical protein
MHWVQTMHVQMEQQADALPSAKGVQVQGNDTSEKTKTCIHNSQARKESTCIHDPRQ